MEPKKSLECYVRNAVFASRMRVDINIYLLNLSESFDMKNTILIKEKIPIINTTLCKISELICDLESIFASGNVTTSKYVKQFEDTCASYLGVNYAIAVSSCTNGLILAVKGLNLKGEVIVPSFTFTATVHSLIWNNIKSQEIFQLGRNKL